MLRLEIENIIKSHGLSLTKARKKVLKYFLKLDKPLSLKTIRNLVNPIDRVTLFRILSSFEERGIIHSIRLEKGQHLYALCKETCHNGKHAHKHIHFTCDSCDNVSCVSIDNFPKLSIANYKVNKISINVSGVCQSCVL